MNGRRIFFFFFTAVVAFSCKYKNETDSAAPVETNATLQIKYSCFWNNQPFQLQQQYTDDFGTIFRIDLLKQYFSFLQLRKDNGAHQLVEDFDLIDYSSSVTRTYTIPAGKYTGLDFGLGIPSSYNTGQDPAQYPNSSPLSVAGSQGMFWTWNTGYIFSKFEGKCDTTGTQGFPLLIPIAIHAGTDDSFRNFNYNSEINLTGGQVKTIEIRFHIDELLRGSQNAPLNLEDNAVTHTSTDPELARLYLDNLVLCTEMIQ